MDKPTIEKTITIYAPLKKVWDVFTDPTITRKMGGEYVSDWKVGSSFNWKGQNGNIYTNGIILEIEPAMLLKHNLFDLNDKEKLLSVITYEFNENEGETILIAREELNYQITIAQLKDISLGWDSALDAVKKIAEEL